MRINLGCNEWNLEGFVNIDHVHQFPRIQPELVANALRLPFADETIDEIYAGHILEHFALDETPLCEWHRVLKPGGRITITVPDIEKGLKDLRAGRITLQWFQQIVYGAADRPSQDHYRAFATDLLFQAVSEYFQKVRFLHGSPYLVADVTWQTIITGIK